MSYNALEMPYGRYLFFLGPILIAYSTNLIIVFTFKFTIDNIYAKCLFYVFPLICGVICAFFFGIVLPVISIDISMKIWPHKFYETFIIYFFQHIVTPIITMFVTYYVLKRILDFYIKA